VNGRLFSSARGNAFARNYEDVIYTAPAPNRYASAEVKGGGTIARAERALKRPAGQRTIVQWSSSDDALQRLLARVLSRRGLFHGYR
jgi:hypothetical protein